MARILEVTRRLPPFPKRARPSHFHRYEDDFTETADLTVTSNLGPSLFLIRAVQKREST